ncbi:Peroxidase 56 [Ancistrocladus abbreviatus]
MASVSKSLALLLLQSLLLSSSIVDFTEAQGLTVGFYDSSCPYAEAIVKSTIKDVIAVAPPLAAALLRMHFHDCFVRGCDGSILLNSPTKQGEKDAHPNLSLRGFQIIDKVKSALEKECPGIVSCADILALVARDAVVEIGGPSWNVETGRRDGTVSNSFEALANLPPPAANIAILKASFAAKGLSVKDIVVLSGAHTIGISHCSSFENRIYNFTGKGSPNDVDPTLYPNYIPKLRSRCKQKGPDLLVEMDPGSFRTFDQSYFNYVSKRRGLFQSDAALLDDAETKAYVEAHKSGSLASFFSDFGESMVKMGRIGVLTGSEGEIRKVCSKVN